MAPGLADGMRTDVDGNVWASAGWAGEGFDGVHIFTPHGDVPDDSALRQVVLARTVRAGCNHNSIQREQHRQGITGRAGVGDVASQGGAVLDPRVFARG